MDIGAWWGYSSWGCKLLDMIEQLPLTSVQFSSVQSLSCVRLFATPWIAARQASLSITNSQSSLRLMSIKSVMPSSHLILCHPLLYTHIETQTHTHTHTHTHIYMYTHYYIYIYIYLFIYLFRTRWFCRLTTQGTKTLQVLFLFTVLKPWHAERSMGKHGLGEWTGDPGC